MKQTLTAKIQILVNDSDAELLRETMMAYTAACNCVSNYIFYHADLQRYRVQKETYYHLRNTYGLRSQMAISCIRSVIGNYKTIIKNQGAWIMPVFKHPQLDLVWNRDYSLNIKKRLFSVNTLAGRIKVPFYNNNFEQYFSGIFSFGTAKLINKNDKFFLYIPITYELATLEKKEVCNVVGVDRGIRFVAVTYDSKGKTAFYSGKEINKKRTHYDNLRRQLQSVGTPSSRRRLKALGRRENRWMQDVNHCISKALVTNNPLGTLFVLEDLKNIRSSLSKTQNKHRHTALSWAYFDLERKLIYKALRNHQVVERVSPAYSSQTCPKCGHTSRGNRKNRTHHFCCKNCGYSSNDDRVAAMNLHRRGIELLFLSAVATE